MTSALRVLPFSPVYLKLFIAAAVACCLFVAYEVPRAQAAGLNDAPLPAVLADSNLAAAFSAAEQDLAGQVMDVFAAPFEIAVQSLTDLFVYAGIGDQSAAVEHATPKFKDTRNARMG